MAPVVSKGPSEMTINGPLWLRWTTIASKGRLGKMIDGPSLQEALQVIGNLSITLHQLETTLPLPNLMAG